MRADDKKPARWRFGVGQTPAQERNEIARAQAAGLTDLYMAGQTHARAIEAERARRADRVA